MDRDEITRLYDWIARESASSLREMIRSQADAPLVLGGLPRHQYVKVRAIGRHTPADNQNGDYIAAETMAGLYSARIPFSLVFASDGTRIALYLGAEDGQQLASLVRMIRSEYPLLALEGQTSSVIYGYSELLCGPSARLAYGGFIKGNPSFERMNPLDDEMPIDAIVRGMAGRPWSIQLYACPEDVEDTLRRQQLWTDRATRVSALQEVSFSDTDNLETTSYQQRYIEAEQYGEKVGLFCERSQESVSLGEWCVALNYSAATENEARLLGGLATAVFCGDGRGPEPLHAITRVNDATVPLVNGWQFSHYEYLTGDTAFPLYATLLSSHELSALTAFPKVDTAGLSVRDATAFDINREESGNLVLGEILDGDRRTGTSYRMSSNQLNRHALVVGLTGSGKTNTLKHLMSHLGHDCNLPFMVIEPAKKEYWDLYRMGFDNLQIYSVGSTDSQASRICINPFERAMVEGTDGKRHGVPLQTHIDFVFSAFKASFVMYTPMPYVLERAIYEIYEDFGWDVSADVNRYGIDAYPTVEDLYRKIPLVVRAMGYDQRMRCDLTGSLQARINTLRIGSKGLALNVERSLPFGHLLEGQVVVELEDVGDDDAKAFIISLLLINLLEVRRQQDDCQQCLRHVVLIEEAHRLLRNVHGGTGEDADPRGAAVEFFCNLLAELRSKGQGFVVADQIPSKLAPDLVKNTNLKIAHRLVDAGECSLMGGSMHMSSDQASWLTTLRQGVAAVYSEGDFHPKLVTPPCIDMLTVSGRERMDRGRVLALTSVNCMRPNDDIHYVLLTGAKSELCRRCGAHCHRNPQMALSRMGDERPIRQLAADLDPRKRKMFKAGEVDKRIRDMLNVELPGWNLRHEYAQYCVFGLMLRQWNLNEAAEQSLIDGFVTLRDSKA